MIRSLFAFALLLASVFLGLQLSRDPGYVLIKMNHWSVESTVLVATFTILLIFTLISFFVHGFRRLWDAPRLLHRWRLHRLEIKAQENTHKGLLEYSEGYWQKAKNHLIQALPNTQTPLLNYLTAARAAQKMGDNQLRDHYLREAQQAMPDAKIAVELTQAQLQLANHQWEQALATLRHLQDLAPHHPYVLKLLMHLYEEVKDWQQLILLLPEIKRHRIISTDEFEMLQIKCYSKALIELKKQNQPLVVDQFFYSLPKSLAQNPLIVCEYVGYLLQQENNQAAETLLRQCLKKEFHEMLVDLYGQVRGGDEQFMFAQSLLKKQPHSAVLFLCLGRLCLARQLWGQAKEYLERSNELNPLPVIYMLLGTLYETLQNKEMALNHFKKGLSLATNHSELP